MYTANAEKLLVSGTGDPIYRYEKSIVAFFSGPRKVLSTSIYNGAYREDLTAAFNQDCTVGPGMPCKLLASTYEEHLRTYAGILGLDPERATGMGTAAHMENTAWSSLSYKELAVTAVVTGGIENNGGRAGDPAEYYKPLEKPYKPGTINIMLFLDADMAPGVLTRALVTCTEAKTAALQELLADSRYSSGLATGSGTDQTILVANSDSALYLDGAGKHSKLGELIGKTVIQTVKEALKKETGLTPEEQHNVLRRLRRFGMTDSGIWARYKDLVPVPAIKPQFLSTLYEICKDGETVADISLLAHLLDQENWGLLKPEETSPAAQMILRQLASHLQIQKPVLPAVFDIKEMTGITEDMLAKAAAVSLSNDVSK